MPENKNKNDGAKSDKDREMNKPTQGGSQRGPLGGPSSSGQQKGGQYQPRTGSPTGARPGGGSEDDDESDELDRIDDDDPASTGTQPDSGPARSQGQPSHGQQGTGPRRGLGQKGDEGRFTSEGGNDPHKGKSC